MDQERLIRILQEAAAEDGHLSVQRYNRWQQGRSAPSVLDLLEHYGSWQNVLRMAGMTDDKTRYGKQELLLFLRRAAEDVGDLTSVNYRKWAIDHKAPTLTTVVTTFGSWQTALSALELELTDMEDQRQLMMLALLEAADELDPFNPMTYGRWARANRKPSMTAIAHRFGSWTLAIEEIGLEAEPRWSEEEMLAYLERAEREHGSLNAEVYDHVRAEGDPSAREFVRMFGNFEEARRLVNIREEKG